jgi:glycerol-3-phosphate acyltransferase PlsY
VLGGCRLSCLVPVISSLAVTTSEIILTIVLGGGGYLLGAVPSALLVSRYLYGIDIRERGTGNVGAGNVRHVLGTRAGALVMACDMAKGFLPALAAVLLLPSWPTALVAFMPMFGHQHSVFLRGAGGKGVATAAGAVLPLAPVVFGVTLLAWTVVVSVRRLRRAGPLVAGGTYLASSFVVDEPNAYRVLALAICLSVLIAFRAELRGRRRSQGTAPSVPGSAAPLVQAGGADATERGPASAAGDHTSD